MIWPSSSSVPTARTSQRMQHVAWSRHATCRLPASLSSAHAAARGTAQPLTTASTTAAHRKPFHSHVASSGGERQQGEPDRQLLAHRLVLGQLARRHADALGRRRSLRYTLMISSRAAMMTTGTTQNTPLPTSVNIAPSTSTLSASGSRKAPDRGGAVAAGDAAVDAVAGSTARTTARTRSTSRRGRSGITQNISGDSSSRPTVTALAQVASRARVRRHQRRPRPSSTDRRPASGGDQVGPERVDDLDVGELPTARSSRRRGRCRRSRAPRGACGRRRDASTSTVDGRADQRVATRRGDVVLQLAQLGEPLGHQRRSARSPSRSAA